MQFGYLVVTLLIIVVIFIPLAFFLRWAVIRAYEGKKSKELACEEEILHKTEELLHDTTKRVEVTEKLVDVETSLSNKQEELKQTRQKRKDQPNEQE
jgi:hypothetical protein